MTVAAESLAGLSGNHLGIPSKRFDDIGLVDMRLNANGFSELQEASHKLANIGIYIVWLVSPRTWPENNADQQRWFCMEDWAVSKGHDQRRVFLKRMLELAYQGQLPRFSEDVSSKKPAPDMNIRVSDDTECLRSS